MKTWNAKKDEVARKWWVVNAEGKTLGRLSTAIADVLRGKTKAEYTPHVDTGDFVVVVNSDKIRLTGNKWDQKKYYRRSKHFGSLKEANATQQLQKDAESVVRKAVKGMLPKNRLSRQILKKLKVYEGAEHPHSAQKPEAMNVQ